MFYDLLRTYKCNKLKKKIKYNVTGINSQNRDLAHNKQHYTVQYELDVNRKNKLPIYFFVSCV